MILNTTGSYDLKSIINFANIPDTDEPIGALVFNKDGTLVPATMDFDEEEDAASVMLVMEYFIYSLHRDDWMSEFLSRIDNAFENVAANRRSRFRVIEGGLSIKHSSSSSGF